MRQSHKLLLVWWDFSGNVLEKYFWTMQQIDRFLMRNQTHKWYVKEVPTSCRE